MFYLRYIDKTKVLILLVLNVCLFAYIATYFSSNDIIGVYNAGHKNVGIDFYYSMHSTMYILYLFALNIFISSNLISGDIYKERKNKFSYLIKTRIKSKKYFKDGFISIYLVNMGYYIISEILLLIFINFFLVPISFDFVVSGDSYSIISSEIFSSNHFLNLLIFILLTSNGYAIFSLFVFSLKKYIKNIYIFRAAGFVIGVLLSILPVMIGQIAYKFFGEISLYIFNLTYITNLIAPGIRGFGSIILEIHPFLSFISIYILMATVTYALLRLSDKNEQQYD